LNFFIESVQGQFRIYVRVAELENLPEVEETLCSHAFVENHEKLVRLVPRPQIYDVLEEVAKSLAHLPPARA
jgi:hypothetical protein